MVMRVIVFIICIVSFNVTSANAQDIWVSKDGSIRNVDAKAMLVNRGEYYLATKNEVYRTKDESDKWEPIFSLPAGGNEISCLGGIPKSIFIGTRRGLYRSADYGASWRNVFKTIIPDKNNILSMELSKYNPKKVLIGTMSGVFITEDAGEKWEDITYNMKNRSIKCLVADNGAIYAGGDSGLYVKKDNAQDWERLLVNTPPEKNLDEGTPGEIELEEIGETGVSSIAIKGNTLYTGVDKRILYSEDSGSSWNSYPREGLSGFVNYILPANKRDTIYCATTKGVFEYVKDRSSWVELYRGMDKSVNVNSLRFSGEDEKYLWAVTDKGVYRLESGRYAADERVDIEKSLKTLKVTFDAEPTFQELQRAAIKYADVSPEKINNWQRESRLRALFPKVSLGYDTNNSTNYEIYTSATRDYVINGPDDISRGLDVSVSWELGDLIWSDDQTNIDVRSRLMVQLRNDILDDLRRAYYERKRIQFELMTEPPQDLKARFNKEMRLQELTSAIDDLTGNYLSERLRQRHS